MDELIETYIQPNDAGMINALRERGISTPEDLEDLAGPAFFISIPSILLMRSDISPESKILYAMIVGITRVRGTSSPTNQYLSKISGIPERSIQRALASLHKFGLIDLKVEKHSPGKPGTWRTLTPITKDSIYAKFPGLINNAQMNGGARQIGAPGTPIWREGHAKLATQSNRVVKNREEEYTLLDKKDSRFAPPTAEEVTLYGQTVGFVVDGALFCDYYAARGWKLGKTPMKDWKAAVRTWKKKQNESRFIAAKEPEVSLEQKLAKNQCPSCKGGRLESSEEYGIMCTQCNYIKPDLAKLFIA